MAFKYLQKNNLQEELNSSVGILAREKPEDLFYALGTHLHQLTKQPEIRASEYLKSDLPVRSPVNFVTHGKLHRSKIFFQNQESEVDIFYQRGEFEAVERDEKDEGEAEGSNNLNETESENLVRFEKLENYLAKKLEWMTNFNQFKPNPNFLATHPLAFTILKNTKITKFKSFNKIYFHSNNLNNLQEIYNKFSENILSALPKPKGTNSEILKRQSIFKNEEFSCFENFNFEKFEAIFDGFLKNFNFADDGSEFFVVDFAEVGTCSLQPAEKVESGNSSKKGDKNAAAEIAENEPEKTEPAFNAAKNSYEAGVGVLKNANDMVDFYFDLAKKYTFIKYFINCFLKKDAELNQVLQDKLQEAGLSTRVIAQTQVEEIGQNIENCPILNATSSANLHDVHALHWNAGKYEVILMDGVGCLNKFR